MNRQNDSITSELLRRLDEGDAVAADLLMPLVYDELRRLAQHLIGGVRRQDALQATALVNEAYLRLVRQQKATYKNRSHFFAIAARMIRRALVDHVRAERAEKRGGDVQKLTLQDELALTGARNKALDIMTLHEVLTELERDYERAARVVELRFFTGMTVAETAEVLGVSERTVKNDWRFAKAWLRDRMR